MRLRWLASVKEFASGAPDLVGVLAAEILAVAFLLVAPIVFPFTPVEAVVATMAAFVFPGYALASAVLPRRRAFLERLVLSIGTGLVAAVGLALILSASPWGLGRLQWVGALVLVSVGAGIAALRERGRRVTPPPMVTRLKAGSVLTIGLFTLSVAITVVTIGLRAAEGPPEGPGFTQLWMLPVSAGPAGRIEVGVINAERHTTNYRLEILVAGDIQHTFTFILASDQEWSDLLDVDSRGGQDVEALLYHVPGPSAPYRRVDLRLSNAVPVVSPDASSR